MLLIISLKRKEKKLFMFMASKKLGSIKKNNKSMVYYEQINSIDNIN